MQEETIEEIGSDGGGSKFSFGKLLAILLGVVLVLGVLYFLFVGRGQNDNFVEEVGVAEEIEGGFVGDIEDEEIGVSYSIEEISLHSTADNCWIVLENNVYDVTSFIADAAHPGGDVILEGCGIDATELFETRPMGSGTPHSINARGLLKGFYIGEVEENIEDFDIDYLYTEDEVGM